MSGIVARRVFPKFYPIAWRTLATIPTKKPYWSSMFPDGRVRTFEEIPLVEEQQTDFKKYPEFVKRQFDKYGYINKQKVFGDAYLVNIYHFEDFRTVHNSDGERPCRQSHNVIRHYRQERKELYDNVGLGPGNGEEWWALRKLMKSGITERMIRPLQPRIEEVADDLVKILHIKANENGAVDVLPWLFRWEFESTGVITLNKRLDALSEGGSEEADRIVQAAGLSNELIGLGDVDFMNFEKHYKELVPEQDLMYSVVTRYIDEMTKEKDVNIEDRHCPKGVVNELLKLESGTTKNVVTLTLDLFQGALQTVPLTVLMALYNLAENPHLQDQVREQLVKLLPTRGARYFDTVKSFSRTPQYLTGIVWETLRKDPPIIGNGRILQKDLVLGGYQVPKGTNVVLHHQVAYRLPENFEEPDKFKPDRHINPHQLHMEYIFGATARICLGRIFALGQMSLVIAKIVRDFEISYHGPPVKIVNRLHNEPEDPLCLKLTPVQ